ncbi:ArsR/SmtB family transcription factor [Microlunatus soli]|uniref:ArsR/SmtB family transcription factor n=1 Tax=Microlunatus soli TaxID=630515 RepID=UPI001E60DE3E|nr:winged helix-turn-helix domain-containing protein [Microlunatus soli]
MGRAGRDADVFWVLDGLRSRIGGNGGVTFAGSVTLADGPVDWQIGATTDQLMSLDWAEFAADLAALGHATRLALVQAVLGGAHTVAELSAMDGMGSTGQLYHHLGQLSSHGWLTTAGRGTYVVPAPRVVPLLAIISATRRMT